MAIETLVTIWAIGWAFAMCIAGLLLHRYDNPRLHLWALLVSIAWPLSFPVLGIVCVVVFIREVLKRGEKQ